jgi:spore germination protein
VSSIQRKNLAALLTTLALVTPSALAAHAAGVPNPATAPPARTAPAAVPPSLVAQLPALLRAAKPPSVLAPGARGGWVLALQALLLEVGENPGPLDGVYGPPTAAAVKRFQAAVGLQTTGVVDRATAGALLRRVAILRPGARGAAVAALQVLLRAHGNRGVPVDGVFGASTLAAVEAAERADGLPVAVSTSTALWLRLLGISNPPPNGRPAPAPAPTQAVIGYYTEWAGSGSWSSFVAHLADLTGIAPLWFTVRANGQVATRSTDISSVVAFAHAHGKRVWGLVTNAGGNDTILVNPAIRQRAVANLVATVRRYDLDGVNIDFELIDGTDQAGLTRFVAMTAAQLRPLGRLTTVAVGPRTQDGLPLADPSDAYDYAALGQAADAVVLMTYDEHDDGSAPGPIAGIAWVRRVLAYALTKIPAPKILLGLADYGYDWAAPGRGVTLQSGQAEALAARLGVPIIWSNGAEEPYFTYVEGGVRHTVWFEDGEAIAAKLALVRADHLGGVAIWSLGHEDAAYFPTLARLLSVTP